MSIRVVTPHADKHLRSLAQHVRRLQEGGASVVFVSGQHPRSALLDPFDKAGVDLKALFVIDAITCVNGFPPERVDGALFLQSPTMLEMIAMRTEQMANRQPNAHVVLDNLNALVLYNSVGPVQEFSHYLANRLRSRDVPGDFVILDNDQGASILEAVQSFMDGREPLEVKA